MVCADLSKSEREWIVIVWLESNDIIQPDSTAITSVYEAFRCTHLWIADVIPTQSFLSLDLPVRSERHPWYLSL